MIYLDNASTTKIDQRVIDAMIPYLTEHYGNPGAVWYDLGNEAKSAVYLARENVAEFLGCHPEQIIFTSGGTEGNNMVFQGMAAKLKSSGKTHIIISQIEHDSVIRSAERMADIGFEVTKLPVTKEGKVELSSLREAIKPETGLVSIMFVNNELGSINPVSDIAKICNESGILFHCDCVQAAGALPFMLCDIGCDFATVSSHKLHGPKGVGALFVKDRALLTPMIVGGSFQEFGMRGGTENVPGIVGFGKACELAFADRNDSSAYVSSLRLLFYRVLTGNLSKFGTPDVRVNGPSLLEPGKVMNIHIKNVDASTLLMAMNGSHVCMSAGSACTGSSNAPSHVLKGIGLSDEEARSSVRVSFSRMNTEAEVSHAADLMSVWIRHLREIGGIEIQ